MPNRVAEIRLCESCGLRYPLVQSHPFGIRCPACMGTTRVILSQQWFGEPEADPQPEDGDRKRSLLNKVEIKEDSRKGIAVLLDNIRSAWNVGSILRSADGFGFTHAFVCGITPTPDHETVTKTSLGAEDSVPWSYHKDAVKLVKGLKAEGWKVSGLEEHKRAVTIEMASSAGFGRTSQPSSQREVLIVGNEVTGVDPELLDLCDHIFHIPMRGAKRSFNVAIAFGIAAYALTANPEVQ